MKKNIVLLLVVLVAGVAAVYAVRSGFFKRSETVSAMDAVKKEDVNRLETGGDEQEVAKSLKRMAFQDPEKAAEFIKRFVKENSKILRGAACESAGGFQGAEWDKLISQCLGDTEVSVRISALKGLCRQPTAERRAMTESLLATTKPDNQERLWANMAVMYAATDERDRQNHEKKVLEYFLKADRENQSEAAIELYKVWPKRTELHAFAEKIIKQGEETQDLLPSFRYLGANDPDRLSATLASARFPDSRSYLLNILSFLNEKCPKGWSAVAQRVYAHAKADEGFLKDSEKIDPRKKCG